MPDTPERFAVSATGKLKPIGHVSTTGLAAGTGFVPMGRETLQLKLTAAGGQLTIEARSQPVPGFTTP